MRVYSDFFSTLHDEASPVGKLGAGAHYSVLRAVLWNRLGGPKFHDFAVIWDEDHDIRIVWVIEQMLVRGLFQNVLFVGERKGHLSVITEREPPSGFGDAILKIAAGVPSDSFSCSVEQLSEDAAGTIINDSADRVRCYMHGIVALWELGTKECEFTTEPYRSVEQ